jgi:hypothetical protein
MGRVLGSTGDAPVGHTRDHSNYNPSVAILEISSDGNSVVPCFIVELETQHRGAHEMRRDYACYFDGTTIQGVLGIKVFEHTNKAQWEAAAVFWVRNHSHEDEQINISFACDFGPSPLSEDHKHQFRRPTTTSTREGLRSADDAADEEDALLLQYLPQVELQEWHSFPCTQNSQCVVSIPSETILRNILNPDECSQVPSLKLDLHQLIFKMQQVAASLPLAD